MAEIRGARAGVPLPSEIPEDIRALSFEVALAELEDIVARLESGQVDLEQSIEIYTRGTCLKAHCEAKLKTAQARVEQIVVGGDGAVATEPFDLG
jgi:exodeoxyribonuclease VII small subunit